jgi:hypothetical protein
MARAVKAASDVEGMGRNRQVSKMRRSRGQRLQALFDDDYQDYSFLVTRLGTEHRWTCDAATFLVENHSLSSWRAMRATRRPWRAAGERQPQHETTVLSHFVEPRRV